MLGALKRKKHAAFAHASFRAVGEVEQGDISPIKTDYCKRRSASLYSGPLRMRIYSACAILYSRL